MPGAAKIKAGEAFWEVTIKDKYTAALAGAQSRLKAFAGVTKQISASLASMGTKLSAIGAAGLAAFGSAVNEFIDLPKRAKEAGKSLAGIDVSKSERLDKSWRGLLATFDAMKYVIGSAVAEPLTMAANTLAQVFRMVAQFAAQNPFAVKAIAATFVAIAAAGAILLAGAAAFSALSTAATIAGVAIGAVANPVSLVTVLLATGGAAWLSYGDNAVTAAQAMADAWEYASKSIAASLLTVWSLFNRFSFRFGLAPDGGDLSMGLKSLDDYYANLRQQLTSRPQLNIPDFGQFGFGSSTIGSSRGTFQGARAENLSIGSGGGQEERRHRELKERLDEEVRLLREISGSVKNQGPVFAN